MQVAGAGWLAQHQLFHKVAALFGPKRIATLESERLTADPEAVAGAVARHFGLALPDKVFHNHAAFSSHGKLGGSFDHGDRQAEHAAALEVHIDKIEKVLIWAEKVAQSASIELKLPHSIQVGAV